MILVPLCCFSPSSPSFFLNNKELAEMLGLKWKQAFESHTEDISAFVAISVALLKKVNEMWV